VIAQQLFAVQCCTAKQVVGVYRLRNLLPLFDVCKVLLVGAAAASCAFSSSSSSSSGELGFACWLWVGVDPRVCVASAVTFVCLCVTGCRKQQLLVWQLL
jgi:hypothetical protein